MGFFKRLLCFGCLPKKKSGRARKKHVSHQHTALEEMNQHHYEESAAKILTQNHQDEEGGVSPLQPETCFGCLPKKKSGRARKEHVSHQQAALEEKNQHHYEESAAKILTQNHQDEEGGVSQLQPETQQTGSHISEESFIFHRVLGRGGFGKVMLAELKASGEHYAIKSIAKASFLEDNSVDSLRSEKRVLMLASESPFLSRLHCTFQTKDKLFLVMEYINGGDLHFHLQQRGYFDLASVRFFAAEIVCGLQFLHSNGVIYRDLKLENVMLDQDGHIKIVDFGLSKDEMFGDSRTDTFCGTPLYIAPEIYQEKEYSTPVDWWAFGVLLFQLLTGYSPFLGENEEELCQSVCWHTPTYPVWVNRCTRDLLGKLLQKDPDSRLGSCDDIRRHPFFRPIDWARIERREVEPPYKPKLDCRSSEEEGTPELSQGGSIGGPMDQSAFFGFSFVNSKFAAHIEQ